MLAVWILSVFLIGFSQARHDEDCSRLFTFPKLPTEVLKERILKKILEREVEHWTEDGLELRSMALTLLDSDVFWNKQFAETFTTWMTLFQNRYESDEPSGCDIAKYINGLANCIKYENPKKLRDSSLDELYLNAADYFYIDSLALAGCRNVEKWLPENHCKNNGLVYKIDIIWENNETIDSDLKALVKKMYKSDSYFDRFLALLATFSLTPASSVTSKMNQYTLISILNSYNWAKQPKGCCKKLDKKMLDLTNEYLEGVYEVLDNIWEGYDKPDACKHP